MTDELELMIKNYFGVMLDEGLCGRSFSHGLTRILLR